MDDLTPEEMNRRIQAFQQAIESEFEMANKADDPEAVKKSIRTKFMGAMLAFADDIIEIANTSTSDSARISAIKFGYDFVFGAEKTPGGVGSLEDQLEALK